MDFHCGKNVTTETIKNAWRKTGYSYFNVPPPNLIKVLQHEDKMARMQAKENKNENHDDVFLESIDDGNDVGEAVDGEIGGI